MYITFGHHQVVEDEVSDCPTEIFIISINSFLHFVIYTMYKVFPHLLILMYNSGEEDIIFFFLIQLIEKSLMNFPGSHSSKELSLSFSEISVLKVWSLDPWAEVPRTFFGS